MNEWLSTAGYVTAAVLAFRGLLRCWGDPKFRGKTVTMFFLSTLFGVDALGWYWSAVALGYETPMTYPPWLHAIDLVCIVAALLASEKATQWAKPDTEIMLDAEAKIILGALAVYSIGIVVYWALIWAFLTPIEPGGDEDHPFWKTLRQAWYLGDSLAGFAKGTIALYLGMFVVVMALLWSKGGIPARWGGERAKQARQAASRWLWCRDGKIWPSLACWLPIPVAIYVTVGPTQSILIEDLLWPTWLAWTITVLFVAAAAVGVVAGLCGACPQLRMAVSAAKGRARNKMDVIAELLIG